MSIRRLLALPVACVLVSCALIRPGSPATVLRLEPVPTLTDWPTGLGAGEVSAVAALRSNRVVVAEGPLLMQYEGVRWIDAPAAMLLELTTRRAAQARAQGGDTVATFNLHLQSFELRAMGSSPLQALVAARAELRCDRRGIASPIDTVESVVDVRARDARAIAEAFTVAADDALASLLRASLDAVRDCAQGPPAEAAAQ